MMEPYLTRSQCSTTETLPRGRISTVHLLVLVKIGCFWYLKYYLSFFTKESARRSLVLSLPLQLAFLCSTNGTAHFKNINSRAYPRVEHLKGASLGKDPALPANKRLGWTGLPETNTVAYY